MQSGRIIQNSIDERYRDFSPARTSCCFVNPSQFRCLCDISGSFLFYRLKKSSGIMVSQFPRTAFMRAGDAPFLRDTFITKVPAAARFAIDVEPTQLSLQSYVRVQVSSHYHAFRRNLDPRAQATVRSPSHY